MKMKDVIQIMDEKSIQVKNIKEVIGSFGKKLYLMDGKYLVRTSKSNMEEEILRFKRVSHLKDVPHIISKGKISTLDGEYFYVLLNLIPGEELFSCYESLSPDEIGNVGSRVASFLDELHSHHADKYDVGHYVPTVPDFSDSWREGHVEYWKYLKQGLDKVVQNDKIAVLFRKVFDYFETTASALEYRAGARILHNDFHPRNIIIDNSAFSGVIDWECSQRGERDFDLSHFVHWTLFPPGGNRDFKPLFSAIMDSKPGLFDTPDLVERLTIYQLEQDLNQIVWNSEDMENRWYHRISAWLDGAVADLF